MTLHYRTAGAVLAATAMAGLVWGSHAAMTVHGSDDAVLRLAWSARPERVEECRHRSEQELARLPQHMRQPLACEGTTAEYRLQVRIDGAVLVDRLVHGGGLRRDRRLYVFEELPVTPGEAAVDVRFDRVGAGEARSSAEPDGGNTPGHVASAPVVQRGEHVPPHLSLQRRVRFSSHEVVLVTYAPEHQALVAVQDAVRAAQ